MSALYKIPNTECQLMLFFFFFKVSKKLSMLLLLFTTLINTELGKLALYSQFPYAAGWGSSTPGTCPGLLTRGDYLQVEARQG